MREAAGALDAHHSGADAAQRKSNPVQVRAFVGRARFPVRGRLGRPHSPGCLTDGSRGASRRGREAGRSENRENAGNAGRHLDELAPRHGGVFHDGSVPWQAE